MGRAERRDLERKGVSKETAKKLDALNTPCTVMEAVQLAQGVVDDAIINFQKNSVPLTVSHTLHIEVMKKILIDKGLITEEDFKTLYVEAAQRYQAEKLKYEEGKDPSIESKKKEE